MADFRKWFMVLAVVALLTGSAVSANAQAFQCTANAGVPPLLRAEGLTELVGDLVLNCNGVAPVAITANIRIFLNTNVTSRLIDSGAASEALLLIDEPAPAVQALGVNVFKGDQNGVNIVDWLGIPIVATGSTVSQSHIYRITDVCANANQLGTSSSLIPTQVFMFISISGTTSVPVNNPQQVVGFIVPGMTFSVEDQSFRQCEEPSDTVDLTFEEGFATAFKVRGYPTSGFPIQNQPGQVYDVETGFTPGNLTPLDSEIGVADQGTRFIAKFSGIPDGIELEVPGIVASSMLGGQDICLVPDAGDDGSGGSYDCTSGDVTITPSGGEAVVVYEVTGTTAKVLVSKSAVEEYLVDVEVVYTSSLPGLGSATVNGNFAPVSTVTVADDFSSPIPRFADVSEAKDAFSINACRTILLFPYVTNVGTGTSAWDTGIAISNTSLDPFDTDPQSGACTIYYYGGFPATGAPAPAPVTTPVIDGGEQVTWVVSTGGGVPTDPTRTCTGCATPGFHGYVIVICDFQYAHGFAFVSDQGAARVSESYLAMVIPDKSSLRSADAFTVGASSNDGEQLVH